VSEWPQVRLKDVCEVIAGQSPKSEHYNDIGEGFPFYQGKKQFTERYLGPPEKWTTKTTREAKYGDILMSVRAPVGPVNFATQKICIGRGLAAIKTRQKIDKDFLFYFLLHKQSDIKGYEGAVYPSINKQQIGAIAIPLPPLPEQKRIVAILDEAFAAIDQATANAEKNLANARELFEADVTSTFKTGYARWAVEDLGGICENLDSRRIPVSKRDRKPGDIPYYGASGIVDYVNDYIFDEDLLLVSEDGANLLARTYPIAFSITGKAWVNNHAHVLRFDKMCSQRFVEYYLNSVSIAPYVSGMAQPKLNQKALNSIKVPFPPEEVQEEVVRKFGEIRRRTVTWQKLFQKKLKLLHQLKQSILQKAFTGELTTDKPAPEPELTGAVVNE